MATRVDEHGEVWLDTATAALVLGFSAQYLGRLAIAERIPGRRDVTRVGRPWLFRRRDIEQLAASTASRRLLREKVDRDACIAELHALTTDPRLLGLAAGTALAGFRARGTHDGDRVARMLTTAGGDEQVRDQHAAHVVKRLAAEQQPGIGNP